MGQLYALEVLPPEENAPYRLTAHVCENLHATVISRELASRFGANREGDEIWLAIEQVDHLSLNLHAFDPIPVKIARFAQPRLGGNYLHLGMSDVQSFFDVYTTTPPADNPSPPMLLFQPLQQYRHWCRQRGLGTSP